MLSLISSSVSAEDLPTIKRIELRAGQKAPFTGQLLTHAAAAKLITDAKARESELKAAIKRLEKRQKELVSHERAVCRAKLDAASKKLKLVEDTCKVKEKILHGAVDRTAKSCERKWYESSYLNAFLGCAACGGLCAGVAAGIK